MISLHRNGPSIGLLLNMMLIQLLCLFLLSFTISAENLPLNFIKNTKVFSEVGHIDCDLCEKEHGELSPKISQNKTKTAGTEIIQLFDPQKKQKYF